jgi:hypothetical protein
MQQKGFENRDAREVLMHKNKNKKIVELFKNHIDFRGALSLCIET